MKKIANIALFMAFALGFSACTEETEYTPVNPVAEDCPRVSFVADGDVEEVSPSQSSVQLVLVRENADSELTVPLNVLQNDGEVFQIPESVTFAVGETTVVVPVTFSNLEIAQIYTYSISLNEQYVDPYAESSISVTTRSVQMIQWNLLGEGTLTNSALYAEPITVPCNIYRASHAHWYKVEEPFEAGKNIIFQVDDEDNSVLVEEQAILTHPSYGLVYISNENGEGSFDSQTNTITIAVDYYCSVGYFNSSPVEEVLTLPSAE